jgi:hypothetical protein
MSRSGYYEDIDALPEKKLITDDLQAEGQVCAIGSVGLARQIDMSKIDPHDPSQVSGAFGINEKLAREIVYENDEAWYIRETPEQRFQRMRNWVLSQIKKDGDQ